MAVSPDKYVRQHILPENPDTINLGEPGREFKNVNVDALTVTSNASVAGDLAVTGGVTVTGDVLFGTTLGTPGTGVTQVDSPAALRQTVLTLTNVVVEVVSVTTGAGVGGTAIFTFPANQVRFIGANATLGISVATAKQSDFTDSTPEGDLGIGTLAPANADALGTDATDDNFCTAAAFAMTAFNDASTALVSEAEALLSASQDVFVNVLVDAADIDDDVTTEVLINGTVVLTWASLGAV